ncbi:MAG: hypothetical protein ACI4AB_00550 [Acetatifactor sp.]
MLIAIITLLCSCGRDKSGDLWGTKIENIQWGMNLEEIQKYYDCSEIVQESACNYKYFVINKPCKIYDCDMEITLILETGYGLVGIKGQTENVEKLEKNIDTILGKHRSGIEWSNGVIWQSELVMERYTYQQLADAYNQVYGDGVFTEDFIKGILGSPFVSYQLCTEGERKGELWINGSEQVYIINMLNKVKQEQ